MAPLLTVENVSVSYDGLRDAVAGLSFALEAGTVFALVGPNGAGKTSTLRMLATLTQPTAGAIRVDGIDLGADPEGARRRIGYLPDNFALYEALTPVDYLDFFARAYGVDRAVRTRRIDELLAELDLDGKRGALIRTLSRGMRQRLGLAKTLVHDPKLLLLDEPASALDPGARLKLREVLGRLKRRGLGILISSHILPDLAGLADQVGIMEGGRLIRSGAVEAVAAAARGHGAVWVIETRTHAERARRVLGEPALHVTRWHEAAGGRFEVVLDGGEDAVPDLVEALVLRGVRISHVAPRESALEAAYCASSAAQVS
jgi:ABC-2 type transport system ATP-binding protein